MAEQLCRWLTLGLLMPLTALAWAGTDSGSAVILLYHHVAADTPRSTSVSAELFEAHLDYLAQNGYQVLPLSGIIAKLKTATPLPPRSVAITFDDAYRSVYTTAAPLLARRGWPYAIFVSTDYHDGKYGGYMTWAELRALETAGAEIGNHSRSHDHYLHRRPGETVCPRFAGAA